LDLALVFSVSLLFVGSTQADSRWLPLPDGEIRRIAFGSCARQWQPQPIWASVIAAEPDLFLFLGDAVYADTDGTTAWPVMPGQLVGEWNRLADKPEIQALMTSVPVMATWDNHDYGTRAGGAEFPLKRVSRDIFLDFFDEPAGSARRLREGVYDAKTFGPKGRRVQVILLDTRYFKGPTIRDERSSEEKQALDIIGKYAPNDDPDVALLGAAQWAWLEEQLNKPAELRLIASGTQIIPDEKGMDERGNYPLERQRFIDLLRSTKVNGVILLSGNVHFGEVSALEVLDYPKKVPGLFSMKINPVPFNDVTPKGACLKSVLRPRQSRNLPAADAVAVLVLVECTLKAFCKVIGLRVAEFGALHRRNFRTTAGLAHDVDRCILRGAACIEFVL